MKIAILSDTRLPTAAHWPGHGLGQIALAQAEGLQARGHAVTLLAGPGSAFAGNLLIEAEEQHFLRHNLAAYDAVLDNSHTHVTQAITGLPAAQISHDREFAPVANAVVPTQAHRRYWGLSAEQVRVIPHGVPVLDRAPQPGRGYLAFLGSFQRHKGAWAAVQAARLAGLPLQLVGPTPPACPAGARYLGPLAGEDKLDWLAGAEALLFPAPIEAAGLVPLEAAMLGVPSVVSAYGGAAEQVEVGVSGYMARDVLELVESIALARALPRAAVQTWARTQRSAASMIAAYEQLALALAGGERW